MNFTPKYCTETVLLQTEISNGALYVTTDTNKLYVDIGGTRHGLSDFLTVANEESLPETGIAGKLYLASSENTLWVYSNNAWTSFGGSVTVDQTYNANSTNAQSGVAIAGAGFLTQHQSLSNYVTLNGSQQITGEKTFVGEKRIKFKQSTQNNKLGFTLYDNNNGEKGYLEFNPSNKVDNTSLFTLGNYASNENNITHVGFRKYSNVAGATGAYNLLAPLVANAKTPFSLTQQYKNFYLPLGFTDGTTTVLTANSGLVDLSNILPTVPTTDQVFDEESTNPQSGVAVGGELKNYSPTLTTNGDIVLFYDWTEPVINSELSSRSSWRIAYGNNTYVLVNYQGYVSTSTDLETWTTPVQNAQLNYTSYPQWTPFTFGNGKFVMVSSSGYYSVSTNGTTWTNPNSYTPLTSHNGYKGVVYGNGVFVTIANYGYSAVSTDGLNWTEYAPTTLRTDNSWELLTFSKNKFVAISSKGKVSTSSDGITWSELIDAPSVAGCSYGKVVTSDSMIIVFCTNQYGRVTYSMDGGLTWSTKTQERAYPLSNNHDIDCGIYDGKDFVLIYNNGAISRSIKLNKLITVKPYTAGNGIAIDEDYKIINTEIDKYWYDIKGHVEDNNELKLILASKQNKLIAGTGISITDTKIYEWSDPVDYTADVGWNVNFSGVAQNPSRPNEFLVLFHTGELAHFDGSSFYHIEESASLKNAGSNWRELVVMGDLENSPPWELQLVALSTSGKVAIASAETMGEDFYWQVTDTGFSGYSWTNLIYNPDNRNLIMFSSNGYMSSSTDGGSTWSTPAQVNPFSGLGSQGGRFAYGNNLYVGVLGYNYYFYTTTSSDGINWSVPTKLNLITNVYSTEAFGFDGTKFVYISSQNGIFETLDGVNWSQTESFYNYTNWSKICFSAGNYGDVERVCISGHRDLMYYKGFDANVISCTS